MELLLTIGIPERLAQKFDHEIRFFKGWLEGPRTVGSIMPTSRVTARSMASLIDPGSGLPVLELGPGTGAITRAILQRGIAPENLYSIEYSREFYDRLTLDYPAVNFIHGDAFDLDKTLGDMRGSRFDSVISGIPLLNFPMARRVRLIEDLLGRIAPGRPVVQISYGPVSPVSARGASFTVTHHDFVLRNVPPAQVWVYRRDG